MNDQQRWMQDSSWLLRAIFLFTLNGFKKLLDNMKMIKISALYWVIVFIIDGILEIIDMKSQGMLFVLLGAIAFLLFLFIFGKPSGAVKAIRDFTRIGMFNKGGETPLLFDKNYEGNVIILTFRNVGIPISHWLDCKDNIESGLNLNIRDIYENGKKEIVIKAVSGDNILPDFIEWNDSVLSHKTFELILGETYTGKVKANLAVTPHLLIGGSTGSGKSILLKCLLMQCVKKNADVIIADFKGGVDFPKKWHDKCVFITERADLIKTLDNLVVELQSRKNLFSESECANITEYNRKYHSNLRRIIFACDEVAELLDKTGLDKKQRDEISTVESLIATIARLGRAFGIHLILATQRPDSNIISGQIKNNIDYRVCGRADDVLSQIILDKTDASDLISKTAQGRFLTNSDVLFQGYWFDDKIGVDWNV